MSAQAYEGIVVLGSPRSGTTLLRRLLNAHARINCPPETNLLSAAARFLHEETFAGGVAVGVIPGLGFSGIHEAKVLDGLRELVFGHFRQIAETTGKPRWAEKTAFDSFHIDGVEKLCGDRVRYVCLFRHPLDVVCSIKELCDKMEMIVDELHGYVRKYPSLYEAFAHAWVDVSQAMMRLAEQRPQSTHRLRYEDLVADPAAELARLFAFLGEPTDAQGLIERAMNRQDTPGLGDWKTYQKSSIGEGSVGRWKSLSATTVSRLAKIVGPTMAALGYEPISSGDEVNDAEARRRYQIGLMAARMTAGVPPAREAKP